MPADQDPSQIARGLAAIGAADALLRTLGGCTIFVRVPLDTTAGDAAELGLQAIATQDVEFSPAVIRAMLKTKTSPRRMEISLPAASLSRSKDIQDANSAEQFFDAALGIIYGEKLWRIDAVAVDEFGGTPYLYRITVTD
jgi:hypothetical protein